MASTTFLAFLVLASFVSAEPPVGYDYPKPAHGPSGGPRPSGGGSHPISLPHTGVSHGPEQSISKLQTFTFGLLTPSFPSGPSYPTGNNGAPAIFSNGPFYDIPPFAQIIQDNQSPRLEASTFTVDQRAQYAPSFSQYSTLSAAPSYSIRPSFAATPSFPNTQTYSSAPSFTSQGPSYVAYAAPVHSAPAPRRKALLSSPPLPKTFFHPGFFFTGGRVHQPTVEYGPPNHFSYAPLSHNSPKPFAEYGVPF